MANTDIPNLDLMTRPDLMLFWNRHQRGRNYTELFPHGGKGSKKWTACLANYAGNTAVAMKLREEARVEDAFVYEAIADGIYDQLPESVRW